MSTQTIDWADPVVNAHFRSVIRKDPREQEFQESPILSLLERKKVKVVGDEIHIPINETGDALNGPTSANATLNMSAVQDTDMLRFKRAQYVEVARASMDDIEIATDAKSEWNLWVHRMRQAIKRLRRRMAQDMGKAAAVTSAGHKPIFGLQDIMADTPSSNPSLGNYGIDRSSSGFTPYRNVAVNGGGAFTSVGPDAMEELSLQIVANGGKVSVWATSLALMKQIKKAARTNNRFEPVYNGPYKDRLADFGISAVSFEGAPVIADPYLDAVSNVTRIYAWDDRIFYFGYHRWFEPYGMGPVDLLAGAQLGQARAVGAVGQPICEEARRTGVIYGLS